LAIDLRTTIPRVNPACNVRSLPIGPQEGFVFSRVDGVTNAADIGAMTGLGAGVLEVLQKLASLGALLDVPGAAPAPAPPPPPPTPPPAAPPPAAAPALDPVPRRRTGPPKYTQAELDEECELEPERRKRILELYYDLGEISHYEVLGVPRSGDRKAIKAAYYKLAPEFHPDKFFRKNLGAFKSKMEAIFKRITEAEEVLSRKDSRAEYDSYLVQRERTAEIEALLRGEVEPEPEPEPEPAPPPPPPPIVVAPPPVSVPAPPPPVATSVRPAPAQPSATSVRPDAPPGQPARVMPSTAPRQPTPMPPRSPEEDSRRRAALAAKLSSGRFVPPTTKPPPKAPTPAEDATTAAARHAAASDSLRRMLVAKKVDEHRGQVDRYLQAGDAAAQRGDAVTAANSYRLAASVVPDDEAVAAKAKDWTQRAAVLLADNYLKQGEYEAREGRWSEAARSLVRAAQGMPEDAKTLHAAAHAIWKAQGDLHQAAEFARRALALKPGTVGYQVTLAEIFLAANLPLNAKRELEAAAKTDPKDAKVRALLDRLR
jgi:tetratricopeptide (TPR) repeat protein